MSTLGISIKNSFLKKKLTEQTYRREGRGDFIWFHNDRDRQNMILRSNIN